MTTAPVILGTGTSAAQLLALQVLATALLIVLAGALMAKWEGGGQQATLARLNRQIFIPCLVFSALNRVPLQLGEAVMMSGGALFFVVCCYPLARWQAGRDPDHDTSGFVPMLFNSTGTLLLPLSYLLFGSQGLAKATFFHLTSLLLLYTWGMRLSGKPSKIGSFLRLPTLHVVVLALLLKPLELDFSDQTQELLWLVEKGVSMMATGALPLLLITQGYALYCLRKAGAAWWSFAAFFRMLWLPLVATALILFLRTTGLAPLERGYDLIHYLDLRTSEAILLLASTLPCAVSLSRKAQDDQASQKTISLILSSALLSVVACAVLLFIINRFIFSA